MNSRRRTPKASSIEAKRRMEGQRQRDTKAERLLRSELHRLGMRFFVNRTPIPGIRGKADIVFPRAKLAVYVDGCFWHGCPRHGTWPKANSAWWREKIEANKERDARKDELLAAAGWISIRVWEHEEPAKAAQRIRELIKRRQQA